jgi:hypothetical protein
MQGVRDGIASRLAWTLKVQPRGELALASALLDKSLESLPEEGADNIQRAAKLRALRDKYPLVPAVLNRDFVNGNASSRGPKTSEPNLASRTLYEAYVSDLDKDSADSGTYESAVDALTMSMAHVHTVAAMKQTDKQLSLPQEYLRRNAAKVSENPSRPHCIHVGVPDRFAPSVIATLGTCCRSIVLTRRFAPRASLLDAQDAVSTTARTLSIVPRCTQQTIDNMTLVGDIREVGQSTGRANTIAERAQLKAAGKAAEKVSGNLSRPNIIYSRGGSRSLRSLGTRYARHLSPLHCSNSTLQSERIW